MIQIISDSVSKVITLIDASHLCAKKIFDIVKLQINSLNCPDSTILLKNDALIFHLFGLAPYNILSQPTRAIYRFGQRGNGLLALFHPFYFCMKRCSLTRLLPMCVFLCMFRLLASLACRLEFQMHATPKRIWNETIKIKKKKNKKWNQNISELEIRRVGGSGYMPLGQAEWCDPEDGKKNTNAGKVAEKSKNKMDEEACSKLKRCCLLSWSFSSLATLHDQMIKLLSPPRRFFFDSFTLSNFFSLLRDSSTFSKVIKIRSSSNNRVVGRKNLCIFIHCEKTNVYANLCLCA